MKFRYAFVSTLAASIVFGAVSWASAVDVEKFSGHITDVGIQRGPGQVGGVEYRIRGRIRVDQALDLGASIVVLEQMFAENGSGGAGELMTMMDDVDFLPYTLTPLRGEPDKVLYDTPNFRPQIRMQLWRSKEYIEFRIKADRGLMRRVPLLCTPDPRLSTTDITHAFTIDDGVNPPVLVETTQPWECNPKDNNLRSRGRRSSVPPPTPGPTSVPGPTPTPGPAPTAVPPSGCAALSDPPRASLRAEALTRTTGAPDLVELDGRGSSARIGSIVRYRFESGDGRTLDGASPSAVFSYAPGDYRAVLTVYDARGACATASRTFSEK